MIAREANDEDSNFEICRIFDCARCRCCKGISLAISGLECGYFVLLRCIHRHQKNHVEAHSHSVCTNRMVSSFRPSFSLPLHRPWLVLPHRRFFRSSPLSFCPEVALAFTCDHLVTRVLVDPLDLFRPLGVNSYDPVLLMGPKMSKMRPLGGPIWSTTFSFFDTVILILILGVNSYDRPVI